MNPRDLASNEPVATGESELRVCEIRFVDTAAAARAKPVSPENVLCVSTNPERSR